MVRNGCDRASLWGPATPLQSRRLLQAPFRQISRSRSSSTSQPYVSIAKVAPWTQEADPGAQLPLYSAWLDEQPAHVTCVCVVAHNRPINCGYGYQHKYPLLVITPGMSLSVFAAQVSELTGIPLEHLRMRLAPEALRSSPGATYNNMSANAPTLETLEGEAVPLTFGDDPAFTPNADDDEVLPDALVMMVRRLPHAMNGTTSQSH